MSDRRDRLTGRSRPTADYQLRVDHAGAAAAERRIRHARTELQLAVLARETVERLDALRGQVAAAEADLESCCETIVCSALPPQEFEDLIDVHPPRKGTDDEAWNTQTFPRACFLECAPDDLSRQEWETFLDEQVNDGERTQLYNTAIRANIRTLDESVPKG